MNGDVKISAVDGDFTHPAEPSPLDSHATHSSFVGTQDLGADRCVARRERFGWQASAGRDIDAAGRRARRGQDGPHAGPFRAGDGRSRSGHSRRPAGGAGTCLMAGLSRAAPGSLPEGSAPYVAAMREAAGRTAAASSVLEAAMGTAAMLKTCGDCHRGVGTMPAAPADPPGSGGPRRGRAHAGASAAPPTRCCRDWSCRRAPSGVRVPPACRRRRSPAPICRVTRSSAPKRRRPKAGFTCSPARRAASTSPAREPCSTRRSWPVARIATPRTEVWGPSRR